MGSSPQIGVKKKMKPPPSYFNGLGYLHPGFPSEAAEIFCLTTLLRLLESA